MKQAMVVTMPVEVAFGETGRGEAVTVNSMTTVKKVSCGVNVFLVRYLTFTICLCVVVVECVCKEPRSGPDARVWAI